MSHLLQGGKDMIVNAIQYSKNNEQRGNHLVKPVQAAKHVSKDAVVDNSYQSLLQQAMKVYQR